MPGIVAKGEPAAAAAEMRQLLFAVVPSPVHIVVFKRKCKKVIPTYKIIFKKLLKPSLIHAHKTHAHVI